MAFTRFYSVYCRACDKDHGLTVEAATVVIVEAQKGNLITINDTPLCILAPLRELAEFLGEDTRNRKVDFRETTE